MISCHPQPKANGERPVFSILIPTWNNLPFLQLCVASIRKNSRYGHQIVLHVNEGKDGSREWAAEQGLDYSFSPENVGVCFAVNSAATLAVADYIVYMNDDMYVCPDWDFHLMEEIRNAGSDLFFYSATAIEPKDVGKKCALAPHDFGRSPAEFDEERLLRQYAGFDCADWNGASWPPNVVHRRLWHLVGGYSTEYFPGFYSDPDFALKLWHAGVRDFKGVAASRVYHFLEVSTNKLKSRQVKKANALFLDKWGMTARVFNRHFLRMGAPYAGPAAEPAQAGPLRSDLLRCRFKKALMAIKEIWSR